ncbi:TraR/DksA family transcriptional regulator [Cryobacterium adonitolivorans]|uniref:TraR/DksA family transcriptional regulator n=1 Tax=Cryobacterium adonitolivorans TaxID=1259189 RepID=UPI001F543100|nr:TraR/DksA C4-type zinc finger protein [Cryobacterium adonitolivorans]
MPALSTRAIAHFGGLLRRQRRDLELELGRQGDTLNAVRAARSGGDADDEHDPEGPTLSDEWSLRAGVHAELAASLAAIDAALLRIDDGSYGRCLRRGEPIGRERLEARPAAKLCIHCAREG